MTTRKDRIDTLLLAAQLLIHTAINKIDPPGQTGVAKVDREVFDGCGTLRVAWDLIAEARFLPEEAQVWIPNETAVHAAPEVATMTFSPRNAEEPLPFPHGPGVLSHKDGVWTFTPATVRTVGVPGAHSEPSLKGGAGGSDISFTRGTGGGNAGGAVSVPESPRRRDLRESYQTYGMGDFPGRPTMHGGHGDYCSTCEGVCFLELMRLGAKL